jgi:hypothetical protein
MQRHRHSEFIRFLNAVGRRVAAGKLIHAVLDNYATHKHPKVLAWLSHHPRWSFHFAPTLCLLVQGTVESFFPKMTRQRIRRGADSDDAGRAFRLMSATCSDRSRPAVPIDVGRGGGSPTGRT